MGADRCPAPTTIARARPLLAAARAGHRAHRRRHLDRQRHPRLPRAERALDQGPRGREDVDISYYVSDPEIRRRPGSTGSARGSWDAEPNAGHRALRRARGAGARCTRCHPEHRRAAPQGGQRPRPGRRDPRQRPRGRVPAAATTARPMDVALDRVRAGEDDPACEDCGGILKSATISFGQSLVHDDLRRADRGRAGGDLLLAVGTTLTVSPIATWCRSPPGRRGGRHRQRPADRPSTTWPTSCSAARSARSAEVAARRARLERVRRNSAVLPCAADC